MENASQHIVALEPEQTKCKNTVLSKINLNVAVITKTQEIKQMRKCCQISISFSLANQ
jgi:hypothetical protein